MPPTSTQTTEVLGTLSCAKVGKAMGVGAVGGGATRAGDGLAEPAGVADALAGTGDDAPGPCADGTAGAVQPAMNSAVATRPADTRRATFGPALPAFTSSNVGSGDVRSRLSSAC